jgi:hypothetical protein
MSRTAYDNRRVADQRGSSPPVLLLGLAVLSTLAVGRLATADDRLPAERGFEEPGAAFYVAEAGLNQVFAGWSTHQAAVTGLAAGDSLELDWQVLSAGDRYRAVIHRWGSGAGALYEIVVQGESDRLPGGERTLSLWLTGSESSGVQRLTERAFSEF